MARPVTLFTGQWADLPLTELAPLARRMGYDGLELACAGDHFHVQEALASSTCVPDKRALLAEHGLRCYAIGNHRVGQAVCDRIDERHEAILPAHVWGDGVLGPGLCRLWPALCPDPRRVRCDGRGFRARGTPDRNRLRRRHQ